MKGFANLGNTCYMSAVVQCLCYAPAVANYFASGVYKEDMLRKRLNACRLCDEFASVVHEYWRTPSTPALASLAAAFAKVHRGWNVNAQHDAHEFFKLLTRTLHESLGKTAKFASLADEHVCRAAWDEQNAGDYSFMTEVFQGQIEVSFDRGDVKHEHYWDVSLSVDSCSSVSTALTKFMEDDTICGRFGDETDAKLDVKVRRRFVYCPLVLVLHLKRFTNTRSKIDKFVAYETEMTVPGGGAAYELFAVVCHRGQSVDEGHYWCMARVKNRWFRMDDRRAAEIDDINSVVDKDAYMLFYVRRM